ncbi:MBL fold metallo-hydrolase, partial [bacterium]|nr:MBL fold metallo-hydrolase [bacterium]
MNHLAQDIHDAQVSDETVLLYWLEQSHFVMKIPDGTIIHIDPFLSRLVKPENHIRPLPLLEPDETPADFVFLTHDHRDHTDP